MKDGTVKIALVTLNAPFGGSTFFLLYLASGLRQAGVACEVFSLRESQAGVAEDFAAENVPIHICNDRRLIFEDRVAFIHRRLARFQPTVVIANIGIESYEMLRYVPRGVLRIGMIHDRWTNPEQRISTYRDVLDHVVVVAAHLVDDVRASSPNMPCSYIPHGIPIPADVPPRAPNPASPLKLIYFGRFEEDKGSRIFPAIVNALHQRQIPFQWTIHGSGSDEAFFRRQFAAEIASGEITMSAPVPRQQLYNLVRQHDIYILASAIEGGPLTLLEGMALGLVPVCGDIPCLVQEVIHPENGFRVPRTEPQAFAEAIGRLHQDRPLLERMSGAARQTVTTHYSREAMAGRYLKLVKSLVPTPTTANWPEKICIRPIRALENRVLFQPVLRPVRRLVKRLGTIAGNG
jgi:glycosyltransferase involved in cell wall biosynthesis